MRNLCLKLFLTLFVSIFIYQKPNAENPPKREFRGVWFTTGWGIDWPSVANNTSASQTSQKAELLEYIKALDGLNISTICFQVRSMGDAMYTSSTLPDGLQIPWSKYISGTRGTSPGWDPLEYVVEECHKRGIEVYAWVNPFRWASSTDQNTWTTGYDTSIKNKGWLLSYGSSTVLNPAIPEVRQHVVNVCKDLISNYRIEGIIFDDYFYPTNSSDGTGLPESASAADYSLYQNSGTSLSIGDWRRENVDKAVQGIYDMIQETRPEVRFVAGPSPLAGASASKYGLSIWKRDDGNGYDNQYSTLYSDPLSWLNNKSVDMMATQIYWHRDHKLAPFNVLTDWWYSLAKHFDRHNCVSMNIYDFDSSMGSSQADLGVTTAHYDEHVANILASREYAAKYGVKSTGVNFYDTRHLVSVKSGYDYQEHGEYLRDNCFQRKSINPEIHWKNTPIYTAVSNLAYSNGKLSWAAAAVPTGAHELTTIRYTVYAIPTAINYETAITDDGFAGEYLQGITYDPSYTLDSDKQSGYWYAVCVFDGYGNEHAPAIYNYSGGTSAKATLTSPSNGGSAKWEQTFSWSVVDGATYHLQISEYENFSDILFNETGLTENSISINLESLVEGKTYYWKVTAQESGKTATDSEIHSFSVSSLTNAPLAQLESPANDAVLYNTATFTWSNTDEYVTSFTFQIATDDNFTNIINSQDIDNDPNGSNSVSIALNGMAAGTYYWRVISKGRVYYDTPSETRAFVVPILPSIDITLTSPDNGHTLNGSTQHFEWSAVEDATYLFEIATDEEFSLIIESEELTANSYDLSIEDLTYSPTYYWRVTAYKSGYKNTVSETKTILSASEYEAMGDLSIETLWNRSKNSPDGFPAQLGGNQRSMAAYNGNVYVSNRNSDYSCQIFEFSGETGEYIRTIDLTGDCLTYKTYAANCIFTDDAGHLCVSNMGTSTSNPLTVCIIDDITSETTSTTKISSFSLPSGARIDYANASGDITADGGMIWGAVSSAGSANHNYVYRWTRKNGNWTAEYTIINQFVPSNSSIGGAPWVMPISSTQFLVDGNSNYPTLYTFVPGGNATYKSGVDKNSTLTPANTAAVGMGNITLGQYPLFIYSNETHAGEGYNFNIVYNPNSTYDFSTMEKYWTVPKDNLADATHSYGLNSVATIKNDDNSATVFVYAPNNGLAAYRISLPEIPVTLNTPANDTKTNAGFDFMWEGIEGAAYTIELSATETFDEIAYSTTTTETFLNSTNISLPNETPYYWRVKASHNNYTTTTSKVARFITPAKPALCTPVLYLPNDEETLSSDIVFIAIKAYLVNVNSDKLEHADNSILEISRTADFSELVYSNDEWVDVQAGTSEYLCIQHTLPISYFTNGTYYWRVRAQKSGYDDAVSAPLTFTVTGQSDTPGITESDYTLEHEADPIYPSITETSGNKTSTWQLTNLWIRNGKKMGQSTTSTNYRGFCARSSQYGDQDGKDILWVAYHNGSTEGNLEKYDAATGEHIGTLYLTQTNENLQKSTFPCNDVFVDGGGNLCVMNLKAASNILQIAAINPATGEITHSINLTLADQRIDHARAIGDITSGEAYIFGTNNNTTVFRWELYDGEVVDTHSNTVTNFYPSKYVTILGTATRIYPVDKTHFYTDGTATAFTLYTFNETGTNATLTSSFNSYEGTDVAPASGNYGNGGTFFIHDGTPFIVYNNSSFASDKANVSYKFNLARVSELTSWGTITKFFGMPNDNIGTVINGGNDYGMLADYLQYDALTGSPKGNIATFANDDSFDRTNIYLYVPGNGMAAYSLSRHIDIFTGADDITTSTLKIENNNSSITFGCYIDKACIYTLSGLQIGAIENASQITPPAAKGVYLLQLTINEVTTTHKIVI